MDDIYVYTVRLPDGFREMVTPCLDGYTVYLDDRLDRTGRIREYRHAVRHIQNHDFERYGVQDIETDAHKERSDKQ